jgi:hypothetical protein
MHLGVARVDSLNTGEACLVPVFMQRGSTNIELAEASSRSSAQSSTAYVSANTIVGIAVGHTFNEMAIAT